MLLKDGSFLAFLKTDESDLRHQMNSMCYFMDNFFIGTKYIQNLVENLEEAFQTKTKRGIGIAFSGASFSQESI